ncbi:MULTISPECIES: DUF1450 domain-containing protein [unclassified Paenibacillus]|uniref:DUF1450 domain-containing protein n=1 Tax=Paenibacillus provencensis TaxID=441151 RepID=A0ABW3PLY3_9BACL|nr:MULTISPECIES: DUF1450 domain-containing protein [unclassified Paenibacillus]MCM3127174.1 YuzB family protein [Paenibacillus sp. MER 78]SFS55370.1 Uncharacterized protein YuzB, UPF0349 family [Paenibacillus sp. 453mf]
MGIVIVEICSSGFILDIDIEGILEAEYPDVAVIANQCLSFCGMCGRRPFAFVNGKRIFAKTSNECLILIKKEIEKELSVYQ